MIGRAAPPTPWVDVPWTQQAPEQPSLAPVNMPSSPPVFAPVPVPNVTKAPTVGQQQITHDQQELQKVRWNQDNPYGTENNHPGKVGKIAHVLSTVANIAGDIFAPGITANIPGSGLNMQRKEAGLTSRLNDEVRNESQNEQSAANTARIEEENRQAPIKASEESEQSRANTRHLNAESNALQTPSLATAYSHAVQEALKAGRDPAQDPIVQHLSDAIVGLQPGQNKEPKLTYQTVNGPDGKPHTYALNEKGEKVQDVGEHYERPQVTNINAGIGALDRESTRFAKPYEKAVSDANSQLEKIAEARTMINGSAEAQALGVPKVMTALVSGAGSGVRITQAELNAIAHARGFSGDFEGTMNKVAGKGTLTSTQQHQITGLLDDVKRRIVEKQGIHNNALDTINGAPTRESILEADKQARKSLSDLEQFGHYAGQTVTLKNGQQVVVKQVHPDGSFD